MRMIMMKTSFFSKLLILLLQLWFCFSNELTNEPITTHFCASLLINKPSSIYYIAPNEMFYLNLQNQLFISPQGDYINYIVQNLEPIKENWVKVQQNSVIFYGFAPSRGFLSFLIYASNMCSNISLNIRIEVANQSPIVTFLENNIEYQKGEIFCKKAAIKDPNSDSWTFYAISKDKKVTHEHYKFWLEANLLCGVIDADIDFKLEFIITDLEFNVSKTINFKAIENTLNKNQDTLIEFYGKPICLKIADVDGFKLSQIIFENKLSWATYDQENNCIKIEPHIKNSYPCQINLQYTDNLGKIMIKTQSFYTRNIEYVMPFSPTIMQYSVFNFDRDITFIQGFNEDENIFLISRNLGDFFINFSDKTGKLLDQYISKNVFMNMIPKFIDSIPLPNNKILIFLQNGFINPTGLYFLTFTRDGLVQSTPDRILEGSNTILDICLNTDSSIVIASIENDEKLYKVLLTEYDFEKRAIVSTLTVSSYSYVAPQQIKVKKLLDGSFAVMVARKNIDFYLVKDGFHVEQLYNISSMSSETNIKQFEFVEEKYQYLLFWLESFENTYSHKALYVESIPKNYFAPGFRNQIKSYEGEEFMNIGLINISGKLLLYSEIINKDNTFASNLDSFLFDLSGNLLPSNIALPRPALDKIIAATSVISCNDMIAYTWISPLTPDNNEDLQLRTAVYPSLIKKNTIPDVLSVLSAFEIKSGDSFMYHLPHGMFVDYDGDPLTVSMLIDNQTTADWITFDQDTFLIQGTTKSFTTAEYNITIEARDQYNSKIETVLTLKIKHDSERYWFGFLMLLVILVAIVFITKDFIISRFRAFDEENAHQNLPQFEMSSFSNSSSAPVNKIKPEDLEILIAQSTSDKIPGMYLCPITGEIMADPWILISTDDTSSHSYEREAIESWVANHDTDPLTRQKKKHIGRNNNLRNAIEHFLLNISVEDMRNDAGLRHEIRTWIRRKGGDRVIQADTNLGPILERLNQSEQPILPPNVVEENQREEILNIDNKE